MPNLLFSEFGSQSNMNSESAKSTVFRIGTNQTHSERLNGELEKRERERERERKLTQLSMQRLQRDDKRKLFVVNKYCCIFKACFKTEQHLLQP